MVSNFVLRCIQVVILAIAMSNAAHAEGKAVKLNAQEAALLIQDISEFATLPHRKKPLVYHCSEQDAKAVIGDAVTLNLLSKNLIKSIRIGDELKLPYLEMSLKMVPDSPEEEFPGKEVLVRYRGGGGDWDITYRFKKYGNDLMLIPYMMAHLDIVRTTE